MNEEIYRPVSDGLSKKNALIKRYPDGTYHVTCFSRPTYRRGGLEDADKLYKERRRKEFREKHSELLEADKPTETTQRADNARRAKNAIFDISACNDWQYFVTLTLDASKVDRYDAKQIVRPVTKWFDNMVQRKGLKYLIVPERHKDGAIHFHGLIAGDGLRLSDSGTVKVPGRKKPIKRKTAKQYKIPESDWKTVYNWDDFKLGYSTALAVYGERSTLAKYMTKYITKDLSKIFGKSYFAGGHGLQRKPKSVALDLDYKKITAAEFQLPLELGAVKYYKLPSSEALNDFLLEVAQPLTASEARGLFLDD